MPVRVRHPHMHRLDCDPAADHIAACRPAMRPAGCVVLISVGATGVARRAPGGPPNGRARREAGPAAARSADALKT